MNRAFHRNASKLRKQLGTDGRKTIDCTGAKQQLLARLAQMRAAMAQDDERYRDPDYSPYSAEEKERIMANVLARADEKLEAMERLSGVRFVSRNTDD